MLVVAVGVSLLVMMSGMLQSLRETRLQYYESYRLAEIFAPVTRAPMPIVERAAEIKGIAAAEGRIRGAALLDMPGQALPVRAAALSLPRSMTPRLNNLYLKMGDCSRPDIWTRSWCWIALPRPMISRSGSSCGDHARQPPRVSDRGLCRRARVSFYHRAGRVCPRRCALCRVVDTRRSAGCGL